MCVHCDWLIGATRGAFMAMDDVTAVIANSPRHTPHTRAAFAAGAAVTAAYQGFFQALRTENAAPLDELLDAVLAWARKHLQHWPFIPGSMRADGTVREGLGGASPEVRRSLAGLTNPDGRPVGLDPAAREVAATDPGMCASGERRFRKLLGMWEGERYTDGTFPTGTKADSGKTFRTPPAPKPPRPPVPDIGKAFSDFLAGFQPPAPAAPPAPPQQPAPPPPDQHEKKRKNKKRRRGGR